MLYPHSPGAARPRESCVYISQTPRGRVITLIYYMYTYIYIYIYIHAHIYYMLIRMSFYIIF